MSKEAGSDSHWSMGQAGEVAALRPLEVATPTLGDGARPLEGHLTRTEFQLVERPVDSVAILRESAPRDAAAGFLDYCKADTLQGAGPAADGLILGGGDRAFAATEAVFATEGIQAGPCRGEPRILLVPESGQSTDATLRQAEDLAAQTGRPVFALNRGAGGSTEAEIATIRGTLELAAKTGTDIDVVTFGDGADIARRAASDNAPAERFLAGAAQELTDRLRFLAQKPGVPLAQMIGSVRDYMTNDAYDNNRRMVEAAGGEIEAIRHDPAFELGKIATGTAIDLALHAGGEALEGKLLADPDAWRAGTVRFGEGPGGGPIADRVDGLRELFASGEMPRTIAETPEFARLHPEALRQTEAFIATAERNYETGRRAHPVTPDEIWNKYQRSMRDLSGGKDSPIAYRRPVNDPRPGIELHHFSFPKPKYAAELTDPSHLFPIERDLHERLHKLQGADDNMFARMEVPGDQPRDVRRSLQDHLQRSNPNADMSLEEAARAMRRWNEGE